MATINPTANNAPTCATIKIASIFHILHPSPMKQIVLDASARANFDIRGTQSTLSTTYASILPGAKSLYQHAPTSNLPSELILALLHGDLPSKMQDHAFADRIGPFVELTNCPGIYDVFVSSVGADAGKGLTLREMLTVIETQLHSQTWRSLERGLIEDTREHVLSGNPSNIPDSQATSEQSSSSAEPNCAVARQQHSLGRALSAEERIAVEPRIHNGSRFTGGQSRARKLLFPT
jgi:hypothetical protein